MENLNLGPDSSNDTGPEGTSYWGCLVPLIPAVLGFINGIKSLGESYQVGVGYTGQQEAAVSFLIGGGISFLGYMLMARRR